MASTSRELPFGLLGVCLVLCLVSFAIACSGGEGRVESGLTRTGPAGSAEQACSRDSECVLVDDCCGCENGGTRQAVRSDAVASLESAADGACAERVCTNGVSSQHRSCTASGAVCRGGRCIPAP